MSTARKVQALLRMLAEQERERREPIMQERQETERMDRCAD
jgi:hypothetical protein